jgi:uncharacterized BrkB/YihY/UPF0761 family membrane protein
LNRKFVISVLVAFVLVVALGFVVHGLLLGDAYARLTPNLYRTPEDAQGYLPFMLLGSFVLALGLTWIYRRGREDKPWAAQGARFGIAVALVTSIPTFLTYYAVQPTPSSLAVGQIVFDSISMVIVGIVLAALNRDRPG